MKPKHRFKTVVLWKRPIGPQSGRYWKEGGFEFINYRMEPVEIKVTRREKIHYNGRKK